MHWVMHKGIIVKVEGKRNTHKVCKKQGNFFLKQREIFKSWGKLIIFTKKGGKCTETGEIGGIFENSGKIRNL